MRWWYVNGIQDRWQSSQADARVDDHIGGGDVVDAVYAERIGVKKWCRSFVSGSSGSRA